MKPVDRRVINTRHMLGFELWLPATKEAIAVNHVEGDEWAEQQIIKHGFQPQLYCHMRKVWSDDNQRVLAVVASTYRYRKHSDDTKSEWHPASVAGKSADDEIPF